jgi:hypothetical protein
MPCFILAASINPLVYLCFCICFHPSGAISILLLWSLGCFWTTVPNITRYRPRDIRFSIRSSSITVYAWSQGCFYCLSLLRFVDSGLRSVSNSLNKFGVFFLAKGLVVPPAISIIRYSLVLLSLLIDLYINIIKSNTGVLFMVSYSSSGITSGDNSYIIGASIGLIGRYLNIMLCVIISSTILSWTIIISLGILIESL